MKTRTTPFSKPALTIAIAFAMIAGWCATARANDDDHDRFFGSKALLTVFEDTYWRWVPGFGNGNVTLPKDSNGNAVLSGIAMMPYPNLPDGINGTVDVTFKAGQQFFMPLVFWLGTSYTDGTAPDPFLEVKVFKKNLKLKLKLDGKTILDEDDAMALYNQFSFAPPIPYPYGNIDSIIYAQGIGTLQNPLSPGRHVFKFDAKAPSLGSEFHITFNVTVQP